MQIETKRGFSVKCQYSALCPYLARPSVSLFVHTIDAVEGGEWRLEFETLPTG